jgi:hypothetical protein
MGGVARVAQQTIAMTRSSRGHGQEGIVWLFPFVHDPDFVSEPDAVGAGGLDSAQSSEFDGSLGRIVRAQGAGEEQMLLQPTLTSFRTPAAGVSPANGREWGLR